MTQRTRITDEQAEQVLAGYRAESEDLRLLAEALQGARDTLLLDAPAVAPSAALLAVFAGGPLPTTDAAPPRRARRTAVPAVAGLGLGLKLALGAGAAVAAVGLAHHEEVLPPPVDHLIDHVLGDQHPEGDVLPTPHAPEPAPGRPATSFAPSTGHGPHPTPAGAGTATATPADHHHGATTPLPVTGAPAAGSTGDHPTAAGPSGSDDSDGSDGSDGSGGRHGDDDARSSSGPGSDGSGDHEGGDNGHEGSGDGDGVLPTPLPSITSGPGGHPGHGGGHDGSGDGSGDHSGGSGGGSGDHSGGGDHSGDGPGDAGSVDPGTDDDGRD